MPCLDKIRIKIRHAIKFANLFSVWQVMLLAQPHQHLWKHALPSGKAPPVNQIKENPDFFIFYFRNILLKISQLHLLKSELMHPKAMPEIGKDQGQTCLLKNQIVTESVKRI